MSRIREARERQGAAAILSLDHAAKLLPLPDAEARAWLLEHDLVVEIRGTLTVCWGDVLEHRRRASGRVVATVATAGLARESL